MSFVNPAPLGGYITGDLIDESQINYWCGVLPDCVDGASGGTYTLSNPLIFNGDDIQIGQDLDVTGAITGGTVDIAGDGTIGTNSFNTLTVNSATHFADEIVVAGSTILNGVLTVAGLTEFDGNITLANARIGYSGSGRILQTAQVITTPSSSVDITHVRNISLGTMATAATALTGTVVDGDWFCIQNSSGNPQTLTGLVSVVGLPSGSGRMYVRISGVWTVVFGWTT